MENKHKITVVPPTRWRNGSAARQLYLAALFFFTVFIFRNGVISYLSIIISGCFIYAGLVLLMGVELVDGEISFPRTIVRAFPFLVVGRRNRAVADLNEITYIGKSFGSEWVTLRFGEAQYPVPFASRKQRLAFFEAIQAQEPRVKIYRAY